MAGRVRRKLQSTPCAIPNNTYLPKVAVKSSHGRPDVEVLPLGVVSLYGLHPDGRMGLEKKLQMTPCTIPNNTHLPKVALKSGHGLPDVEVLPLAVPL